MPPSAGEERLVTVFADIHYYFTEPTRRPSPYHHRFDKGSYVYIYHDAFQNKARMEIANNPGSPEQDAFCGGLSNVHIRHSAQFPTLCTLTVDAHTVSPQQQYAHDTPQHEWRLPSGDPRDDPKEVRDFARLHTLDIYFWTQEDADDFLDTVIRLLSNAQVETDREPAPQPQQNISSVVQQLETVAVSDPAYQNGQTRNSRSEPTSTTAPVAQAPPPTSSFPPPPPSGPPVDQRLSAGSIPAAEEKKDPASFAPLPYNPAAPAAPEPIQYREKTPPPEDGMNGTGLAAAVAADSGMPYTPPHQMIGGAPGVGGYASPPSSTPGLQYAGPPVAAPPAFASPPPSVGIQHSNTFPTASPGMHGHSYSQSSLSGQGGQGVQQYNTSRQGSMSFAPPPQDPNAHLYDQNVYGAAQAQSPPQYQAAPAAPIGGFSNYSYDKTQGQQQQQQQQHQRAGSEYDIHSQLYRPTEVEAGSHYQKYAQKAMKNPGQRPRKLEDRAERLEGGMNRFFKKLERKL
ncbi:uncharacterized protein N7479_007069 [Penicillium vulpinum]|uniref:RNA recognition motif-containing protein n=1 Tax=Penicillium vulpinum TaxID=29845 RepID=A0A1V6S2H0_9EURO|nr:uncharacterized protein N7479_007069 [Penicillium vulpinum]KAJ5959919.1 hypothetical protein N7479_007069 [Penicillium vulpinum]OQE08237.1 hypothetical protein PENVUL_c010G03080 [Penicillium vulpinum]